MIGKRFVCPLRDNNFTKRGTTFYTAEGGQTFLHQRGANIYVGNCGDNDDVGGEKEVDVSKVNTLGARTFRGL